MKVAGGAAFGLKLEVDDRINIPGILDDDESAGPTSASQPPTRVLLDRSGLELRWNPVASACERVRELHDGDDVLLSVDFVPAAGYLISAPGLARILVIPDGTELLCDPEPGVPEWTTLITAQALPLAATLRGFEVLHASGVVVQHRAALFVGSPGAGKSSLAAALLRLGADLLSDDAVTLEMREGALIAHPGAGLLHLRDTEHDRLSTEDRSALGPPAKFPGKRRYTPRVITSAAPFGGLFLLERNADGPPVERIEAVEPVELLASTFNLSVRTPERLLRHFDLAATLAATERVYRVRIQAGMDATRLAQILHEQLMVVAS